MKITIVNGTNRTANRSIEISHAVVDIAKHSGHTVSIISMNNFDTLFRGHYIHFADATLAQKEDIRNLITADVIIFVVPTYHNGIPSSLKNFIDILKCTECYDRKVIGIISSNSKNQDLGARQGAQTLNGILAHLKLHSFVVPIIPIIDYDQIDMQRIKKFISYCAQFVTSHDERGYTWSSL